MNIVALLTALSTIFILTMVPIFLLGYFEDISLYFSICSYIMLMFVVAFFLFYFISEKEKEKKEKKEKEEEREKSNNINKYLKFNLDDKEVWLIDYENCPDIPSRLREENIENVICYIFANHTQNQRLKDEIRNISTKAIIETIWTSQIGKNLVDIKLAMYVGMINSLYNPKKIIIESKDRGFESLIKACNDLNIYNVEIINPSNTVLVKDEKCKWVYWRIKDDLKDEVISLGNFKKKIKNKILNISSNEVNYIVKFLEENNYIELRDTQNSKNVILKKENRKK